MAMERERNRLPVAVTALCLVQFIDVLGVTVVVTSLPSMLANLHASQSDSSLVATGYAMFFGGLLMLGARVGDRYGHRRTILASLAVFAVGAAAAATAPSIIWLTAGRCLQGAAAAASVPCALRLLTTVTPDGLPRRRAIAAWSAAGAAAGASGFVIGGIVTDLASWRFIFWAYIPLTAALAAIIAISVPSGTDSVPARSLNLAGSATFTAAVMTFVVGCMVTAQPANRAVGIALLVSCAVLSASFVIIDRRAEAPLLPRQLIRRPDAASWHSRRLPEHRHHKLGNHSCHLVLAEHAAPQPAGSCGHATSVQPGGHRRVEPFRQSCSDTCGHGGW